jgi:RNA polymerase sigma-70 factor, ECF subfamily
MNQPTTSSGAEPVADLTTDELIAAVLDGHGEFYGEIVSRYQQSVLRIVTAMLYDRSTTEDMVQQVFVNAYQHLDRFEAGRDFGAWIRTIARNVVREELRRASRYEARLRMYGEVIAARWEDELQSEEHEQSVDKSLEECLKHLTDRAAEVVRLRYREGRDFNHIAEISQTSSGAARNLLSRTLAQLRECIQRTKSESDN